jgi:hypothetical protein
MAVDTSPTNPIERCTEELLRDLAELDFNANQPLGSRSLVLKAALESIDYLERAGGGSLGMATIDQLRHALFLELEKFAAS